MKGPNLSSWALSHGAMMRFMIVLTVLAGVVAYLALGRQEDPDFTVKNMLVSAAWPGASAQQVADQLAEPIERAIQTIPEVDYTRSTIKPGEVVVNIALRENVPSAAVPEIWTRVRQRVGDRIPQLPEGVQGPQFNDDFGDTFGNIYALSGDGYTLPQLKEHADRLRDLFRALPDSGRIELQGAPQERIYIEVASAKLASLGIGPDQITRTLRDTNTVTSAGTIDASAERVRVAVTGTFNTVDAIRSIGIAANGRSVRLGDIAVVTRTLSDPATYRMRFGGRDAVGLMVALRKGGDVTRLGKESEALIEAFRAQLPVGIRLDVVADQPAVVTHSIGEFTRSLAEAIAIVLAVTFLSLGFRPGIVVALSIPIVLALTFATMLMLGIPLHRVSLGALIVALGLLVDDAIIVIEQIDAHLHSGWRKITAVVSAYMVTAKPMLIGTLITMLGFLPIALADSTAGEYSRSLFHVVAISLGFSWIVAVFVTPFIANMLLKEGANASAENEKGGGDEHGSYDGRFYRWFRGVLRWSLDRRTLVIALTAGLFVLAMLLFSSAVPKQFFPTSDRPELIVDLRATRNASFSQTMAAAQRMERALLADKDVASVTTYVGGGTPRFYLSLDVQTPNLSLAQLIVKTRGEEERHSVQHRIEQLLSTRFPDVRGRVSTLELGPPVGQPFKIRLTGQRYEDILPATERLEAAMRADARLGDVNKDYGEAIKTVTLQIDQDKARALGITSLDIGRALQSAIEGVPITRFRDGDRTLEVLGRLQASERNSLDRLSQTNVPTATGSTVPLSQVARLVPGFEPAEINRRSGLPTITIQADVTGAQPADIADGLKKLVAQIRDDLPADATLSFGGTIEESGKSQASVFSQMPIALILILLMLIIQLQSNKKMALVVMTGPLALIGMALILSIFRIPFGFVAMLGGLSLFGMVIRNSVILVSQIDALQAEGHNLYEAIVEATVHRLRPILLTALAAILAMIPLTHSVFWGPMAWSIMGGLLVATLLTLVFLPALYAAAYGARRTTPEEPAYA